MLGESVRLIEAPESPSALKRHRLPQGGRSWPSFSRAHVKALDSMAFMGELWPTKRTGIFTGGAWLRIGMKPVIPAGI